MITSFILYIVFSFVWAITSPLRLLPDASLPSGISDAITAIGGYISPLNEILPVSALFSAFGLILGVEAAIVSYRLIMWLVRRLPTQS